MYVFLSNGETPKVSPFFCLKRIFTDKKQVIMCFESLTHKGYPDLKDCLNKNNGLK